MPTLPDFAPPPYLNAVNFLTSTETLAMNPIIEFAWLASDSDFEHTKPARFLQIVPVNRG